MTILPRIIFLVGLTACQTKPITQQTTASPTLKHAQALLALGEFEQAFPLYLSLAKQGQAMAQFSTGLFFRNGWARTADEKQACHWFKHAAHNKIITAQHFFAQCLEQGISSHPKPEQAIHWYIQAAQQGHTISWCDAARLRLHLSPQTADLSLLNACQNVAQSGNQHAQFSLGQLYLIQQSKQFNPALALQWLESSASSGHLPAYLPTATLYFEAPPEQASGKPSAENLAKSYLWLTATVKRATHPDTLHKAETMLQSVNQLMPSGWRPKLDLVIEQHLKSVNSQTVSTK